MDRRLVKIGEAAKLLGTTPTTFRNWERTGEIIPARKTKGGTRYYDVSSLLGLDGSDYPNAAINLNQYGVDTLKPTEKRIQEFSKSVTSVTA